jgi:putative tryptophan/tyrosine transport system substrate-binding protein
VSPVDADLEEVRMTLHQLKRREFIAILGSASIWPLGAHAQKQSARVGVLIDVAETHPAAKRWVELFETQLGLAGWQRGRNVEITYRWGSSNPEHLARHAEELIQSPPDVFMVHGTPALIPLRKLTSTIPIVFTAVSDPISQGFVNSVSRPGGNLTGFSNFDTDIGSKWLQVLKDIAPSAKDVSVMFNPRTSPYNAFFMKSIESAAPSFGVFARHASVQSKEDIQKTIVLLGTRADGGLILPSDPFTYGHAALIGSLAADNRLPGIYAFSLFAENGGLVSYGIDNDEQLPKAADYAPPIQAPTHYRMVINLKTAKTLNLQVPPTLLALADDVVE